MKKIIIALVAISLVLVACEQKKPIGVDASSVYNSATENGDRDTLNLPKMTFATDSFKFGTITEGEKVAHGFEFTNTGKSYLNIISASGSCGCTVPEWPKKPIAPGEKGIINVTFNSAGKNGHQTKDVTIHTNCEPTTNRVFVVGDVISKVK